MSAERLLAWLVLFVFGVWSFALEGWMAERAHLGAWTPEFGLLLAFAVLARAETRHLVGVTFVFTLARAAVGIEPPIVLLAGFASTFFAALCLRGVLELSSAPWRTFVAFVGVLAFEGWLTLAEHVRGASSVGAPGLEIAWRAASTSALVALALGPLLVHLPGLTPLRTRRW